MTSRRTLLRAGLAGLAALPATLPLARFAHAALPGERRFVLVNLRGGLDGLAAIVPYADPDYRAARGRLALGVADLADLDGRFAVPTPLAPLAAWFRAGEVAIVHAVASPYRERSHFDAQDLLENGSESPAEKDVGFLNRALTALGATNRQGLAVGSRVPLALRGPAEVMSWAPSVLPPAPDDFLARVEGLYAEDALFQAAFAEAARSSELAQAALGQRPPGLGPGGGYGPAAATSLGRDAARLMAAPGGPRLATLDLEGWDTHAGQPARIAAAFRSLAGMLGGLREGLGPLWAETVVLAVTEFGRTVAANGSGGTDHGTASVALLAGGRVASGRVLGDWPGLGAGRLYQGRDLAPTTDLRAVLKGVLGPQLGLPADALDRVVFPGSAAVRPLPDLVRG